MIRLEAVTKAYGATTAVDSLTLEIADGELCVLIGPSGCGKTTTLRMINRLVEPTSGRILVGGVDTSTLAPEALRRGLGYAIQSVGLFPHLTVAQNIVTVPKLLGWERARMDERVTELLELVGLAPSEYRDKYPRQLSGGEAQRIGVARALAADPPALLMDEPFGAVDPLNRERLQGEFARIQRELGKTVVFVTHDVDEAIRLADRIALMRGGRLVQHATPEDMLDHPADPFVRDFMGSDRGLKRLGRVKASAVMRTGVPAVDESGAPVGAADIGARFAYVLTADGRLLGWVDREGAAGAGAEPAVTRIDARIAAVSPDSSLKETLSRMLELGFRSIAVVDGDGRLLGEVALADIEAVLGEGDARAAGAARPAEDLAP